MTTGSRREGIRIQNFRIVPVLFRCLACFRCACYFRCFGRFGFRFVSADLTDSAAALSNSASDVASASLSDSASDVISATLSDSASDVCCFRLKICPAFLHQCFRLTLWLRASHPSVFRADISNGSLSLFHFVFTHTFKNILAVGLYD